VGSGGGSATITDTLASNLTLASTPACGTLTGTDTCSVTVTGATLTIKVTLAAGDSVAVTFTATVSKTGTATVVNKATITTGPCNTTTGCTSTVTNPVPAITIVKSATPTHIGVGGVVTYKFVVTDSGGTALKDVTVTDKFTSPSTGDVLTSAIDCVSLSNPTGTCSGTSTDLAIGQSATFTATYTATVHDQTNKVINNSATASGFVATTTTKVVSLPSTAQVVVTPPHVQPLTPNFTVTKTDVPGTGKPVTPGATIPYTITVRNVGTGGGSAILADTLPSNLALSSTPACGTLTGADTCKVSVAGTKLTITVHLAAGDSVQITFTAKVSATDTTNVKNTATIVTGTCTPKTGCTSTVTNPVTVVTTPVVTSLPFTGAPLVKEVEGAIVLILLGAGLLLVEVRRRRRVS